MQNMKTFAEFTTKKESAKGFPSFTEVKEGKGTSCMSEMMMEKLNEMYEAMCEEMKACHADESEMTAENYMGECESKMNEMKEGLAKTCSECMIQKG
jgi:hypothetical protein